MNTHINTKRKTKNRDVIFLLFVCFHYLYLQKTTPSEKKNFANNKNKLDNNKKRKKNNTIQIQKF